MRIFFFLQISISLLTNGERFGNLTKLSRGGGRGEAESLEAPGKEDLEGQKDKEKST